LKNLTGTVHLFGHDIDTSEIVPLRFLSAVRISDLARYCMKDADPEFAQRVIPGDMIVAGKYFGCGSGVEQAPLALKALGISCVIARSFGRIFYRNAINIGLPVLECQEAFDAVNQGDQLEVDVQSGEIVNRTKGETYQAQPFPTMHQKVLDCGGLMEAIRQKVLK